MKNIERALREFEAITIFDLDKTSEQELIRNAKQELADLRQRLKGIEWEHHKERRDEPENWTCRACGSMKYVYSKDYSSGKEIVKIVGGHAKDCWLAACIGDVGND